MILLRLGVSALGVFNQIYAIYVIAGQIAVFGFHDSVQKHVSEFTDEADTLHSISLAAIVSVILAGFISAVLLAILSKTIGRIVQSEAVGLGILFLSPGLFFFTINKVLMGILNGQRRMAAFAAGLSFRAMLILAACLIIAAFNGMPSDFGIAFTCAETCLFAFLVRFIRPLDFSRAMGRETRSWVSRHIVFGTKAVVHGLLTETFLRVDIIMLGIFLGDRDVGIYSVAAFFVEGIYQVPVVIRNIVNPVLVRLLLNRDNKPLIHFVRKVALLSFSITLVFCTAIIIVYPHLGFFLPKYVISASYAILITLLLGLVLYSGCLPFDYIFLEAGHPGIQSGYMFINSIFNVVLNFFLIPPFGLYGACAATTIAFMVSVINLNILSSKVLGLGKGIFLYA